MPKQRGLLVAGNWKMNHGLRETDSFFDELKKNDFPNNVGLRVCIIPSFLSLSLAQSRSGEIPFPIHIGAQNVHWAEQGAFTGEISPRMLEEVGIRWALVGHSERRQFFGETEATALKRAEGLLRRGFSVIFCFGETLQERQANRTQEVILKQLEGLFSSEDIRAYLKGQLILAYEPVWAIGTGLTATPQQAEEIHCWVRKLLSEKWNKEVSEQTSILYGGSVTPDNVEALFQSENVDGALVGGASLKAKSFFELVRSAARILGD